MKIIIAGAGEVGFHLAKLLSFESQEITLIDTNKDSLLYADTHLDIRVIKGDATSISILKDARVDASDLVIAVTSSETTNITVCVLAKHILIRLRHHNGGGGRCQYRHRRSYLLSLVSRYFSMWLCES